MLTRQNLIDQATGYFLVKDQVSRNIRDGRQTQHRKPVKLDLVRDVDEDRNDKTYAYIECADGQYHHLVEFAPWVVGQIIYLREAFIAMPFRDSVNVFYRAQGCVQPWPNTVETPRWKPSIHMPKAYARTFVRIKRVWVERISEISEADALAEGCSCIGCKRCDGSGEELHGEYAGQPCEDCDGDAWIRSYSVFRALWQSIYPGSWERNDWVWACEFEVIPC